MNSADAWHEDTEDGLAALLGLSVELVDTMNAAAREVEMEELEAAKQRHPSGGRVVTDVPPAPETTPLVVLNALDRCDQGCGAAALYRVGKGQHELDFCHHHYNKIFPTLVGWNVVGSNKSLYEELYHSNRLKGGDHA